TDRGVAVPAATGAGLARGGRDGRAERALAQHGLPPGEQRRGRAGGAARGCARAAAGAALARRERGARSLVPGGAGVAVDRPVARRTRAVRERVCGGVLRAHGAARAACARRTRLPRRAGRVPPAPARARLERAPRRRVLALHGRAVGGALHAALLRALIAPVLRDKKELRILLIVLAGFALGFGLLLFLLATDV